MENTEDTKLSAKNVKAKYTLRYTLYFKSVPQIDGLIDSFRSKASYPSPSAILIYLPPCDTTTFSGDFVSWSTFTDMFLADYITNPHISNTQKMYYPLQKTDDKAQDNIRTCPMTNDGFEVVCLCRFWIKISIQTWLSCCFQKISVDGVANVNR